MTDGVCPTAALMRRLLIPHNHHGQSPRIVINRARHAWEATSPPLPEENRPTMPTATTTTTTTATEQIALGLPVPAFTPHTIVSSMPEWKDNVGFKEGDPRVCDSIVTGYPRFIIHKSVQLVRTLGNPGNLNLTAPLAYINSLDERLLI